MYRQNTCSYQNNLVIAVTIYNSYSIIWPLKEVSSACQTKVILINKSLPVGHSIAPVPAKGLRHGSTCKPFMESNQTILNNEVTPYNKVFANLFSEKLLAIAVSC